MKSLSEICRKLLRSVLINVFIVRIRDPEVEHGLTSISLITSGSHLELTVAWSDAMPATMGLRRQGQGAPHTSSQPLVEALASGHGRNWSGQRYVETAIGQRLRHSRHRIDR